jgi:hypothetical protein
MPWAIDRQDQIKIYGSTFYSFPPGGMSKGGAGTIAPPIFTWEKYSKGGRDISWQKWCIIPGKSLIVTGVSDENTSPSRGIIRSGAALCSTCDSFHFHCAGRGSSIARFTIEEKEQNQEEETKDFEGPPRQTAWETRLDQFVRTGDAILRNRIAETANQEMGAPGKDQNGEPGGSPFQLLNFRRRGVI